MRKVFDNAMVAHVWAQQRQSEARSHNGNFWFDGDTIFSYRTPIARLLRGEDGAMVALISSHRYSISTNGHRSDIYRALPRTIRTFEVPHLGVSGGRVTSVMDIESTHRANLSALVTEYGELVAKMKRARTWYGDIRDQLQEKAHEVAEYGDLFSVAYTPLNWEHDAAEVVAHRAQREARLNSPEAIAKRSRDAERRKERNAEKLREAEERAKREAEERAQRIASDKAAWLEGARVHHHNATDKQGGYRLRVVGDVLETSGGARVPLDHAIKAFRMVKRCRDTATPWQSNGHTIRVGHFQVNSIDAQGNMIAGCHLLNWPEIERIAQQVGVFDTADTSQAVYSEVLEVNTFA